MNLVMKQDLSRQEHDLSIDNANNHIQITPQSILLIQVYHEKIKSITPMNKQNIPTYLTGNGNKRMYTLTQTLTD